MTLGEARSNIGRTVIYQPPGQDISAREEGVITAVSTLTIGQPSGFVMVRYRGDLHAKATAPGYLTFSHPSEVS